MGVRGSTSGSISSGEISSLDHEVFDHSVELAAFITESFLKIQSCTGLIHNFNSVRKHKCFTAV